MNFFKSKFQYTCCPFKIWLAYLKFQKADQGVHRKTKLPSKFPLLFDVKKPSVHKIPNLADNI